MTFCDWPTAELGNYENSLPIVHWVLMHFSEPHWEEIQGLDPGFKKSITVEVRHGHK
jgi:hypothetical protein